MNKTMIISTWAVSFAAMILSANSLNVIFWLSLVAFAFASHGLKKLSKIIK